MAREEIIAAPLQLWLAPVGEPFPAVGVAPTGGWELIGAAGDENYTDDGITVNLGQTVEEFIGVGSTMAIKAFRTEESVEIGATIADIRNEVLRIALNNNSIDETTGQSELALLRGVDVHEYALLARGKSPYEEPGNGQFQVPRCYMSAEPAPTFQKGTPAGVELMFRSLMPDAASLDDFRVIYSDASII